MQIILPSLAVMVLMGLTSARGGDYWVAPDGNDDAAGGHDSPLATIQHAADLAGPGDTVLIRSGSYAERVVFPRSGSGPGGFITFKAAPGASVTVDGSGQVVTGRQGLLEISGKSFLRIEGLVVRNFVSTIRDQVPVGILVQGACRDLELVGNEICEIASLATVTEALDGRDAHGLAVIGDAISPISNLVIRGNTLHGLTLGSSEALVLNGNVERFQVLDNQITHCDNIGIDLIGFEGTAPSVELDQARDGIVAGNRVWRIDSGTNPSYGGETSAAGIYVDGGRNIVIERNRVSDCNIGIEVASEHAGMVTRGITVRSNLVDRNQMGGLFIGGYNSGSTGDAEDCVITNNTFYGNDTDPQGDLYGQIHIQYRVSRCVFRNNILHSSARKDSQEVPMIIQWNRTGSGNLFDHNLYFSMGTPVWVMMDEERIGWEAYGQDVLSGSEERFGDPQFIDVASDDFTPAGPEAIGSGDASALTSGERDLEGDGRLAGAGLDRGAVEVGRDEIGNVPLEVSRAGADVMLVWPTREGYRYDVDLWSVVAGSWEVSPGGDSLQGTGGPIRWRRVGGPPAGLVRVRER